LFFKFLKGNHLKKYFSHPLLFCDQPEGQLQIFGGSRRIGIDLFGLRDVRREFPRETVR